MGNGAGTTVGSGPLIAGGIAPAKGKRPEENSQKAKFLQNNSLDGKGHGRAATPKVRYSSKYDAQRKGTPRNNRAQNKSFNDAMKEAGIIDKNTIRRIHDKISKKNYNYHEIVELAEGFKKKR